MVNGELREKEAINHLLKIEIRFHVVKLITVVMASIVTAAIIINYVRIDSDRTRQQINCIVDGFLLPPDQVAETVHKCRQ